MNEHEKTRMIAVEQLCVGLYVYLDISWMRHTFSRNSFKIKSLEEIGEIRSLGLKEIRVNPRLSDGPPLPLLAGAMVAAAPAAHEPSANGIESLLYKKNLAQQFGEQQTSVLQCEKQFSKAIVSVKAISMHIFARPQEAYEDAAKLVGKMLETLLTDANIATRLMPDRMGSEDMYAHSLNVTVLSMMLGKKLELAPEQLRMLGIGCLFHDIGKADIAANIRNKMEPLSRLEKNSLQAHCELGTNLANQFDFPKEVADIILQHHEAFDGSGYPKKLKGEGISRLARIVAVVNTYDNLCNHINPANSITPYEALSFMFKQRASFDPAPFNMFIRCMGIYPPGTLVKLSDGTFGMVVAINSNAPMRPSVLIYDPGVPKGEAIVLELHKESGLSVTTTITLKQLPEAACDYLNPKKRQVYFSHPSGLKGDS